MYSLVVTEKLTLPDGRIFMDGDTATGLTRIEALELVRDYPGHFEAADDATKKLVEGES